MKKFEVLVCSSCGSRNPVRADNVVRPYKCRGCSIKENRQKKFLDSLGEAKELVKESFTHHNHRYVLVDCVECMKEFWQRFDIWLSGRTKCWGCSHPNRQKHGKTGTALFKRWANMIRRTEHSKEPDKIRIYQDRGIKVCDEWRRDFEAFERWAIENGFEPDLFLDRIDNTKGYSPENCRWVTPKESTKNRRKAVYL